MIADWARTGTDMEKAIQKAKVLIEALPYIQDFRDAVVVIKFGGSAMEEQKCSDGILTDITFMECVGMKPVIVHGGGKAISRRMAEAGLQPVFAGGLRVTDKTTMSLVRDVLFNEINADIVAKLEARGARPRGVEGQFFFKAGKFFHHDEKTGTNVDIGMVGTVTDVDDRPLRELIQNDIVPVITPIGMGADNELYNINADEAAAAVARKIKARKLVFLSDIPGLLKDRTDPGSVFSTLTEQQAHELIGAGVIDGGMLPKVKSGLSAMKDGVRKVHIIDGRMRHSLLLEIFTDKGVGTEIIHNDKN